MRKKIDTPFVFHNRPFNVGLIDEICPTITLECSKQPGITIVQGSKAYGFYPGLSARYGGQSRFVEDATPTLLAETGDNKVAVAYRKVIAIDQQGGKGGANYSIDIAPTICSDSHGTPHAVAYGLDPYNMGISEEVHPTLGINCGMSTGRGGVLIDKS